MAKYAAYGCSIADGTGVIAQVRNITGPGLSLDTVDVTEHDGDGWEEVVPTILRSGTVTLDIVYDPDNASHIRLLAALTNKTKGSWTLTFPDAAPAKTWSFSGYVTGFSPTEPVEDSLTASVTIKPTGAVSV